MRERSCMTALMQEMPFTFRNPNIASHCVQDIYYCFKKNTPNIVLQNNNYFIILTDFVSLGIRAQWRRLVSAPLCQRSLERLGHHRLGGKTCVAGAPTPRVTASLTCPWLDWSSGCCLGFWHGHLRDVVLRARRLTGLKEWQAHPDSKWSGWDVGLTTS